MAPRPDAQVPTSAELLTLEEQWIRHERNDIGTYEGAFLAIFRTMGDATRMQIMLALWEGTAVPHQLASLAEVSRSTISHHLTVLEHTGLISRSHSGRTTTIELTARARAILGMLLDKFKDAGL